MDTPELPAQMARLFDPKTGEYRDDLNLSEAAAEPSIGLNAAQSRLLKSRDGAQRELLAVTQSTAPPPAEIASIQTTAMETLGQTIVYRLSTEADVAGDGTMRQLGIDAKTVPVDVLARSTPEFDQNAYLYASLENGFGSVQCRDLPPGFAGRILGAGIAAYIATAVVGTDVLAVIVGFIVLFAVGLTLLGLSFPITTGSLFVAGTVVGVMGTLTGIGAPPMAILYSKIETRRSAATQNAFYGFGTFTAIIALSLAGVLTLAQLAFAATLAPLVPVALWVSKPLAVRFERGAIRSWALGLATLSALALLWRSF